jgi:CheY-specific phosphatase CheX
MPAELSSSLLEVILRRTLEEAAFVYFEPGEVSVEAEGPVLEARLRYAGDDEGELRLALSESFASTLAANMLGEEEGGAAVTGDDRDAVGELLNMIAGALVLEVFGRYARCALDIPQVRRVGVDEHRRALEQADVSVGLLDEEGHRVHLSATSGKGRRR